MKRIALRNFFRDPNGDYSLYETDLGWSQRDYDDAMSCRSEDVLRYHLDTRYDFYFFYPKTMRWYYIDTCSGPRITLVRMKPKKDWDGKYIEDNIEPFDMDDNDLEILFSCNSADEFMKGATIDGEPISDVVSRSYINFS